MDLPKYEQKTLQNKLSTCNQIRVRTNVRAGGGYVAGVYYPDRSGICDSGTAVQLPDMFPVQEGTATQLPDWYPVGGTATQLPDMFPVGGTATHLPDFVWVGGQKIYDMSGSCR